MRRRALLLGIVIGWMVFTSYTPLSPGVAHAELTKQDVTEIRTIIREELVHVNRRMDDLSKRMDDLNHYMQLGFGITFAILSTIVAGMLALVGFVLWDRRTAIAPVQRVVVEQEKDLSDIKRKERLMEEALRDFSKMDPRMGEALRHVGLA